MWADNLPAGNTGLRESLQANTFKIMMKLIIASVFMLFTLQSISQAEIKQIDYTTTQSTTAVKFRLFPTQNMWTFIKLNTRNGKMWQVQYDVKADNRFETILNAKPLVLTENEANDRFTLYSTQNIYTFILLDQSDGRTWQVQWSIDPQSQLILPID